MAVGQEGPWHSVNADIYHDDPNCQTGSSIDPENIRRGTAALSIGSHYAWYSSLPRSCHAPLVGCGSDRR